MRCGTFVFRLPECNRSGSVERDEMRHVCSIDSSAAVLMFRLLIITHSVDGDGDEARGRLLLWLLVLL